MAPDLRLIAYRLNGEVSGGQVVFPPPGHSLKDRSACLRFDQQAPGGFVIHSFAGDNPLPIRDFVRERLRLPLDSWKHSEKEVPPDRGEPADDPTRTAQALALWHEGVDSRGTPAETYLRRRGLELPEESAGEVIRFHRSCPFGKSHKAMAMVCLVRNIHTDQPQGVHRTAISLDGQKAEIKGKSRMALGAMAGGAIKITPDESVTLCLGIGEGVETTLSLRRREEFGPSPVWSLISAGGVHDFPVVAGIESLFVAVDRGQAGEKAARTVAHRWHSAGQEAFLVTPIAPYADLNDLDRER